MDESLEGQKLAAVESWDLDAELVLEKWRQFILTYKAEAVCACLLLLMAANLLTAISRKSITNDEIVHIPAGYYHLVAGDFHLNNEHPPLVKMWAALPLLFIQPDEPPAPKTEDESFMERTWGFHERFWQENRARFQSVTFWPRVMMIPITLALGALIFLFARKLFGESAALVSVALYVLEPTVLAHGRIVHTDLPAALAYLLFFFMLHRYTEKPVMSRAVWLGLAGGVALLTKFSLVVIVPLLVVLVLIRLWTTRRDRIHRRRVLKHAGLVAAIILLCVNAAYYFQRPPLDPSDVGWVATKSAPLFGEITTGLRVLSKVVPTYYLFGIYNVAVHNHYGHATSLMGQHSDLGWWYYFPVAFGLKTSLPFLLLSVTAVAWSLWMLAAKRDARFLFLVVPLAIYVALSVSSNINIGIRHFLPAYPFLFIAGGALLAQLLRLRRKFLGVVVVVLLFGWMSVEAVRTYPDYISYMNQLASAHPHWWYLSDSNVEWGDDVGELAAYLKARGETRVRAELSAGWSTLRLYGVEYISLRPQPGDAPLPETRYVAIGAAALNGSTIFLSELNGKALSQEQRVNFLARYRERKPEVVFGKSIYLYREKE